MLGRTKSRLPCKPICSVHGCSSIEELAAILRIVPSSYCHDEGPREMPQLANAPADPNMIDLKQFALSFDNRYLFSGRVCVGQYILHREIAIEEQLANIMQQTA